MTPCFTAVILGAGNVAGGYDAPGQPHVLTHAHAYLAHTGFSLKGFFDTNVDVCRQMADKWGVDAYPSIEEIGSVDVVSVCTPDACHLASVRQALTLKPKFIFLEKPAANRVEDAQAILALSQACTVSVNYTRRFVPELQVLAARIQHGEFGDLLAGTGCYGKGAIHNGSHLFDLVRMLLGNIASTHAVSEVQDYCPDDPSYAFVLSMEAGATVFLHAIDCRYIALFELDLVFQRARVRILDSGERIEYQLVGNSEKYAGESVLQSAEIVNTRIDQAMSFAVDEIYRHLVRGDKLLSPLVQAIEALHFG